MKDNTIFTERQILVTIIVAYFRAGMIGYVSNELQLLAKTVCINMLHFLNSGHSSTMNKKPSPDGEIRVINAYNRLITDCFLSLCVGKPNERATDCLNECIRWMLELLSEYNSLDRKIKNTALDTVTMKRVLLFSGLSSTELKAKIAIPDWMIDRLIKCDSGDHTLNYGIYRIVRKANFRFAVYKTVTMKTYKPIGKPVRVMKLLYRHMSAYIKGNKALTANTKTIFVDDVNNLFDSFVKLDKMQAGLIQSDNATSNDVDNVTEMIESMALTQRQRDILGYRLQGKSMQWICKKMHISDSTFRTHMARMQDKAVKSDMINTVIVESKATIIDDASKTEIQIGVYKDDKLVGLFDSIGKCAVILGLDKSNVAKCVNGKRASHKGYTFKAMDTALDTDTIKEIVALNESMRYEYGSRIKSKKHMPTYSNNAKSAPWYTQDGYNYSPVDDVKQLPMASENRVKPVNELWYDDNQIRYIKWSVLKNTVAR